MSVIQSIRERGAWIVFGIIALALIAFILQDGVKRGGSAFSNTSVIGKVNGQSILRGDFEEKITMQEKMYGAQGPRDQVITSVWNQDVEELLLEQEYNKLGLQVSGKELSDILFGTNSPLRQEFTDQATGVFKADEARQAFAQLKKSKNAEQIKMINSVYINPTVQNTLRNKYQNLMVQAAYIPKWLLEKQQADNNAISNISYVYVPYPVISDSLVKVTDAEIEDYVKEHRSQYTKTEETRSLSYISVSSAPSSADSASTYNLLMSLKEGFLNSTDAASFLAKNGTEAPFYDSYFSKSRMQQPNKDSLVKIPVGNIMGPYLDGTNYTLAKMIAQKPWPDSAKVRHILIATVDPQSRQVFRADSTAKRLIDSIETAVKGGADFNALVQKYSDDPGSKTKGGVYEYFPQGQMVVPFNDFAFDKPVGSKGIVKTDYGYHYVEVTGQKNMGPAYKLAYLSKPIIASSETVSYANTEAARFAASCKNAKDFNANALKENKLIYPASDIKQNDFSIQGLGLTRSLVRWVYEHGTGDISEPMEIGDRYVVAMVTAVNKAGLMNAAEARPQVENFVRNEKKAKIIIDTKFKGNTLESYAASSGAPVLKADSLAFSAAFISGIGSEPKIIGAAFNKTLLTKASEPIAGATGVFGIKVNNISAKAALTDPESIRQTMLQSIKMISYRGLVDGLKKAASIKDNRAKYY